MPSWTFGRSPRKVPYVSTPNRTIKTTIPAPGTESILQEMDEYESRSMHGQLPIAWKAAEGHNVYDLAGNKFIDFTSTIFVANVGHSNARVRKAVENQLSNPLISTYAYANESRIRYLKALIKFAGKPFEKAFLLSAGTEATEAALKLMKMHASTVGKRRRVVICIEGNWHGRTMGAQLMSSNAEQKAWIGPLDAEIVHIAFPYPWNVGESGGRQFFESEMEKVILKGLDPKLDLAGFMLETFQGWGAVFYPTSFVKALSDFAKNNGILLAFDEMQSGFARTGKRFGFEHYGVVPDLIACGKGMGGGFPLSGVLGRREIMDLPEVGNMSSTHSANPLVTAAGLAVLEEIESSNLVEQSRVKGEKLDEILHDILGEFPDRVIRIQGKGLIAAILFQDKGGVTAAEFGSRVSERCMEKGLLVVHTGRESIKIGPPLTISEEALLEGLGVLRESIIEVEAECQTQ